MVFFRAVEGVRSWGGKKGLGTQRKAGRPVACYHYGTRAPLPPQGVAPKTLTEAVTLRSAFPEKPT